MTVAAAPVAAAGVGFGHAVLPDQWVPLAVVGRTQQYSMARIARLSGLAGVTHLLVSMVLGAVIVIVGLQFRSTVEHAQNAIVGGILIATGVAFGLFELRRGGHGHGHHHHHHDDHSTHAEPSDPAPRWLPEPSAPRSLPELSAPRSLPEPSGTALAAGGDGAVRGRALTGSDDPAGVPRRDRGWCGAAVGALVIFALVTVTTIVGPDAWGVCGRLPTSGAVA